MTSPATSIISSFIYFSPYPLLSRWFLPATTTDFFADTKNISSERFAGDIFFVIVFNKTGFIS
jgi:hypothetical protein